MPGGYTLDQINNMGLDEINAASGGLGMKNMDAPVNAEDQAALTKMVADVEPVRNRALAARQFMDAAKGVPTGPRYGKVPVLGGDAQSLYRRQLASSNPELEAKLENLESINSENWPQERPTASGPIRTIEAQGWKSAFPSIVNLGDADQAITDRDWQTYADKSNAATFAQNYVHSGKGGTPAAQAAFEQTKLTPNAQGRHQALGAQPGDFSGRAPGWQTALPPKQLQAAKLYGNSNFPPGHQNNPYVPQSMAELRQVRPGQWFLDDDGTRRQMPGG
jgi:hypothetical protein